MIPDKKRPQNDSAPNLSDSGRATTVASGKKQPGRKKMYRSLMVLMTVSLLSIGLWWTGQRWLEPAAIKDPSVDRIFSLERRIASLEQRIGGLAGIRNDRVKFVESSEAWWLAEVERYLVEASERIKNSADVQSALPALKSARSTLEGVDLQGADATAIDRVKDVLDVEIQSLEKYENHAAKRAMTLIDDALGHFEHGAIPDKNPAVADNRIPTVASDDLWTTLTTRFKRMVVVETQAVDELQQLNQGLIVHSLMLAKTAILSGDTRSYRYAVANALRLLEQSDMFDPEVYADLQALQSIDITPSPPSVDKTLREVRLFATEILP